MNKPLAAQNNICTTDKLEQSTLPDNGSTNRKESNSGATSPQERTNIMEEAKYSVCEPWVLRGLCIRNNWFNAGTNSHYDKLFFANNNGYSIDEIAAIIWLCSDSDFGLGDIRYIKAILKEAREEYLTRQAPGHEITFKIE